MKEIKKVYGPYMSNRPGARPFVVVMYMDGTRKSKFYARFLWEQTHGEAPAHLQVDHVDEDAGNDVLDNYQLLTAQANSAKHTLLSGKSAQYFHGTCPVCSEPFMKRMHNVVANRRKGKAGPFCSRRCAGIRNQQMITQRGEVR